MEINEYMKEMTYEDLKYDFDSIVDSICQSVEESDYYKAVCMSKFICNALYIYNYTYRMDRLEEGVLKIGKNFIGDICLKNSSQNRFLFYDGFGLYNRGLANIYIDAFLTLGYEVTWVLSGAISEIHEIVCKYNSKVRFRYIPCRYVSIMDQAVMLADFIKEENPGHLFFYTYPNDVMGAVVFSTIKGSAIRYLINLTDHAYWLGRDATNNFTTLGKRISFLI